MKIQNVRIHNFRKYQGFHEFNLNKKITIFYGPNGFGKSSFFDALEWCISGEIGRFSEKGDFKDKDVLCFQADRMNCLCSVEIDFEGHTLSRSFNIRDGNTGNISVKISKPDGSTIRNKGPVDQYLRNQFYQSSDNSLLGGLIKQSHILSQDQVTDFIIRDDAKGRFEALADIMGLKSVLQLIENVRDVHGKLGSMKVKILDESKQLLPMINRRKNDLMKIDQKDVKAWSKQLGIHSDNVLLFENIKILQNQLMKQTQSINNLIVNYEKVNNIGYVSISKVLEERDRLNLALQAGSISNENATRLVNRIQSLIHNLSVQKNLFERVNKLEKDAETQKKTLEQLSIPFPLSETTIIQNKIDELRTLLDQYTYALSCIKEYTTLKSESINLPKIITHKENEIQFLDRRAIRIKKAIEALGHRLSNLEDGPVTKLLSELRGIYDYINQHDTSGKCPVCSTEYGESLSEKVEHNIQHILMRIQSSSEEASRLMNKKSFLDKRLQKVKQEQQAHRSNLSVTVIKLDNGLKRLKSMKENLLFNEELFILPDDTLTAKNDELIVELQKWETADTATTIWLRSQKHLDELKEQIGTKIINSEEDTVSRVVRLNRALERIQAKIIRNKATDKDLRNKYDQLLTDISYLPKDMTEETKQADLRELIQELKEELGKSQNEHSKTILFENSYNTNQRVLQDISMMETERTALLTKSKMYEQRYEEVSKFIEAASSELGNTAKDFLNQPQSSIQRYFRYLNPLPTTLPVRFEGDQNEMKIMVPVSGKSADFLTNAQSTLSSGQLNVLAIAIFLAINESQKVSILDFIAIDDPIQNMDDVNQFSICDVLGGIQRQLLFATHDFNFVKLFIKKNEHQKEEIQVYMLDSPSLTHDSVNRLVFD